MTLLQSWSWYVRYIARVFFVAVFQRLYVVFKDASNCHHSIQALEDISRHQRENKGCPDAWYDFFSRIGNNRLETTTTHTMYSIFLKFLGPCQHCLFLCFFRILDQACISHLYSWCKSAAVTFWLFRAPLYASSPCTIFSPCEDTVVHSPWEYWEPESAF